MSVRSLRYNTIEQHFTKGVTASTDRDALAFLEAAQIYNANQQRAIVNLVRSLKRVGLWSKMKAIYPFVGGTATSHKWNLKDPRDVDAAFRLTFSGGWTHSSNGAKPNGTNGYADTYVIPNTHLLQNNTAYSFYMRDAKTQDAVEVGATDASSANRTFIQIRNGGGPRIFAGVNSTPPSDFISVINSVSTGLFVFGRNTSSNIYAFENANKYSATVTSTGQSSQNIYLSAYNSFGTAVVYSMQEVAFFTIGESITDSERTSLSSIIDLYQKRLGRAV